MTTGKRARVGVFGIGLAAYWPQFPGLEDEIRGHLATITGRIGDWAEVVDGGLVDTATAGAELGDRFAREDLDLVFCYSGTYATSTQALPVVQRAGVPVVILNLQPASGMDYETADTTMALAFANVCPVPELAGVFQRSGIPYSLVTGTVHDDERAWAEIEGWCRAAGAARSVRRARFGMLGHTYPGMIDMSTDVGVVHSQLGAHVELLEMNDLQTRVDAAGEDAVAGVISRSEAMFEPIGDISPEAWETGGRVAAGLGSLASDFALDGLAYYYRGASGSDIERTASNMILGNTLLTANGVPAAGEGDLKTAVAMKIMHELGHGLGVQGFLNKTSGALNGGLSDPYTYYAYDNVLNKGFESMTSAERALAMRTPVSQLCTLLVTLPLPGLSCQPMSANSPAVMSTLRCACTDGVSNGSIRAFGATTVSKCENVEPPATVVGEYRRVRPATSVPARVSGPSARAPVTGAFAMNARPSARSTWIAGMVMVASSPPMVPRAPAALLTMITPLAPAFCAFLTLTAKPQVPRSISATLPATSAALVIAVQPSLASGPSVLASSSAATN